MVFTVVRHPLVTAVSQINYVLAPLAQDANTGAPRPDTLEWRGLIGYVSLPETISDDFVRDRSHDHAAKHGYRAEFAVVLAGQAAN